MYFLPYIVDPGCLSKSDLAMRTLYSNLTGLYLREVHIYLVEDLMRKYGIHMLTHMYLYFLYSGLRLYFLGILMNGKLKLKTVVN